MPIENSSGDLIPALVNNLRASGWAQVIHARLRKKSAWIGEQDGRKKPFTSGEGGASFHCSLIEQSQRGGMKNPPRARLG